MESDRLKWNRIFASKETDNGDNDSPPAVPSFIKRNASKLPMGRILDIASGDGAASLYLASKGYQLTAADISEQALKRLSHFAREQNLLTTTLQIDFDYPASLLKLAPFDGIVISRYKPSESLWPTLVQCLKPGGKLLIGTFNYQHHLVTGFSERYCLQPGELAAIHPDLDLIHYQSVVYDENQLDEYLMQKVLKS